MSAMTARTVLVVLTNYKYVLWTIRMLTQIVAFSMLNHDDNRSRFDIVCLSEGRLDEVGTHRHLSILQSVCDKHVELEPIAGRSIRWQKIKIFSMPMLRSYDKIVYMDSDFIVKGDIGLEHFEVNKSIAIRWGQCGNTSKGPGRYREFWPRFWPQLALQYPKSPDDHQNICLATNLWVVNVATLPPVDLMATRVRTLFERYPLQMYVTGGEQGFIQLLFWNSTDHLKSPEKYLQHLYRQSCRLTPEKQCSDGREWGE